MKALFSLCAVLVLVLIAYIGTTLASFQYFFAIIIPYTALVVFLGGFIYRVMKWAKSPVPFRIPTTCGQQESLPWIKQNKIENPSTALGVFVRMLMEVLFFRSLFRNTKMELGQGSNGAKLGYGSSKWLWLFGLVFHWSLLIILIRHLRLFLEPIPAFVGLLDSVDSMFKIGLPAVYITDALLVVGISYLFLRRVVVPQLRYISLAADYFPLFMIMGIAVSGMLTRYYFRVDIVGVKGLAMGLITFNPVLPQGVGSILYIHLFLVSSLFIYFPMSKLMHAGGIFLSPTRNMINNNRRVRHINPWNYPVEVHSYAEYEDDFRSKMIKSGIPVEKE